MKTIEAIDFHSQFNAKDLVFDSLAKSFVAPSYFDRIAARQNVLIVGPRGSGKTTLLRMLQPSEMASWKGNEAEKYVDLIDYASVFIPADFVWDEQLKAVSEELVGTTMKGKVQYMMFLLYTLRKTLDAIVARIDRYREDEMLDREEVIITVEQERLLVEQLCTNLGIRPRIPTLPSLSQAVLDVSFRVNKEIRRATVFGGDTENRFKEKFENELSLDFDACTSYVFDALRGGCEKSPSTWAMCFDELELAPDELLKQIFQAIRIRRANLIHKVAINPAPSQLAVLEELRSKPTAINDFVPIKLWYEDHTETLAFCKRLWTSLLPGHPQLAKVPGIVLGHEFPDKYPYNKFGGIRKVQREWYNNLVRDVYSRDSSFRAYLGKIPLKPEDFVDMDNSGRAEILRKARQILQLRRHYRIPDASLSPREGGEAGRSARKRRLSRNIIPEFYAWADSIFIMSEGNPRWFKALVHPILEAYLNNQAMDLPARQRHIEDTAAVYLALIKGIAVKDDSHQRYKETGVYGLLLDCALYFQHLAIDGDFNPEAGNIVQMNQVEVGLEKYLSAAVNFGAMIYLVEDSHDLLLRDYHKRKFRLSYMLSPLWKLPTRKSKHASWDQIRGTLREKRKRQLRPGRNAPTASLFDHD